MAATTASRPLALPLAGGDPGTSVRLHPLLVAEQQAPPTFLARPSGPLAQLRGLGLLTPRSRWSWIPIPAFLVEHPTAGPILVDCGFDASVADDPGRSLGRLGALAFSIRMRPEQAVPEQLRRRGIEPARVRTVVMTHLHFDHSSGCRQFDHATFVVDRAELEAAARGGFTQGYRPSHLEGLDWRTVDFDRPEVASHGTFGRSIDLLGDGSVRLLSTPGHSRGHLSVLLRLRDGEALLTGDAAYARRSLETRAIPYFCPDEHRYRRSLDEIERYVERTPGLVVAYGHDAETWPSLAASYD